MEWVEKAKRILVDSLFPIPTELNELDWKSGISCKTERLAQHICAMANQKGGGLLVFGVHDDGSCFSMKQQDIRKTVETLGNIAKNNLAYSIAIEHSVIDFKGFSLLFIFIPEQTERPVHMRGKDVYEAYHRSAGQTVKMSRNQVKFMIAESQGLSFENQIALSNLSREQVLDLLNYKVFYHLLDKDIPTSTDTILNKLEEFHFCRVIDKLWCITNLGAILLANNLQKFPTLRGREVIVRKYIGENNRQQEFEQHGKYGYAAGFEGLIDFIYKHTSKEKIGIKREFIPTYPHVAIREFVANALVHQDFAIIGTPITIEIFSNRLVITNPGAPLNDINRLIDLPPQSRNEELAQSMFMLNICERRGSGVDRAVEAIENMFLPAAKFTKSEQHTRVFIFPQKKLSEMTKQEKISACYQHACLKFEDNMSINNKSIRERFEINKNSSAIASRIIADTLESGLIKIADEDVTSKKYATYIPFYG